jgi:V/A-type H+-transporting ATPase subunit I
MFRAAPMKRFWMAVPTVYEDSALRKIGELGAVQFTREMLTEHASGVDSAEVQTRFSRLRDRIYSVLQEGKTEKHPATTEKLPEANLEQISSFVTEIEKELDGTTKALNTAETEKEKLNELKEHLNLLDSVGLTVGTIGTFRHVFVKVGFLNNLRLSKLDGYTSGTSVVCVTKPGKDRETFTALTGSVEDQPFLETTLKLLNFEEFSFPPETDPDPNPALDRTENAVHLKDEEILGIRNRLSRMRERFESFEPQAFGTLQVETMKKSLLRTKKRSLIEGWIPASKIDAMKQGIEEIVPKEDVYLKLEDPKPVDKVPSSFENKGIARPFSIFVNIQGTPGYFEINPTPIYAALFIAMFGIMFGDMGGGAIFIFLGYLLTRKKTGLFSFSRNTTRRLGQIIICCGVSAIFFGFLYNEFFLMEILPRSILNPLQNFSQIITVALIFGAAQLVLGLILNIINRFRRHELSLAILSGRGILGLVFYLAGIILAVTYLRSMNFGVFVQQGTIFFSVIAVSSLALIFLYPLIESRIEHKKGKFFDQLVMGFGEGFEIFLSYLTNSVSYIRLAAFAIAHGALAYAATVFAGTIGNVASLLFMNAIVFLIEGFAAFIQSTRLMYYEFSTKFFIGDGTLYKPFRTKLEANT